MKISLSFNTLACSKPILRCAMLQVMRLCGRFQRYSLLNLLVVGFSGSLCAGAYNTVPAQINLDSLCIPAVSCSLSNIPNLDGCCINHPSGHFLHTQFWDTAPAVGANDTWTIHGLWPDYCKGGFDAYCDSTRSRPSFDIVDIIARASDEDGAATHPGMLDFMNKYWLSVDGSNANLWAHEWNKHGTCISTIEPPCYGPRRRPYQDEPLASLTGNSSRATAHTDILDYFTHTVMLFNSRPTFEYFATHDIIPSNDKTYTLEQLQSAIRGSSHGQEATIKCRNGNELSEIWYHFVVRGHLRNAMDMWFGNHVSTGWIAAEQDGQHSNCPESGIRYLPKEHDDKPGTSTIITKTHTATATATHTQQPTSEPFTGKGRLMVKVVSEADLNNVGSALGSRKSKSESAAVQESIPSQYSGCLIRRGTWYMSKSLTSCATFTARDDVRSILSDHYSDDDTNYHLFTIASRLAPCSFVPEDIEMTKDTSPKASVEVRQPDSIVPLLPSFFSCDQELPFQSIFSNNATIDPKHADTAKKLTVGSQHQSVFFAENVPKHSSQERIFTDDNTGTRNVEIEIYWEPL